MEIARKLKKLRRRLAATTNPTKRIMLAARIKRLEGEQ